MVHPAVDADGSTNHAGTKNPFARMTVLKRQFFNATVTSHMGQNDIMR